MKATGIIRHIDDLGRVTIPKEIRRFLRVREEDPLEIFAGNVDGVGVIYLRKYVTNLVQPLTILADRIDNEMMDNAINGEREEIRKHFNEIAKILKEFEERG